MLDVIGRCAGVEVETQSALAELEEAVARLAGSVAEVRQIGIRVYRIAINAAIRAASIGSAGNALDVVAGIMQCLALDTDSLTDEVAGDLDAIAGAARRLTGGSGLTAAGERPEADQLLSQMRDAILKLHSASEATFARLSAITALSTQLSDAIQSARDGFSAGSLFGEAINRACRSLEVAAGQAALGGSRDIRIAAEQRLDDCAIRYTMQAEREVHESVAKGTAVPSAPDADLPGLADAENLGENVEFF